MQNGLKSPFKVIWFLIAWPVILGWKCGKACIKGPAIISVRSGNGPAEDCKLPNLFLGIAFIVGIPYVVWVGIPFTIYYGVEHFLGNHTNEKNFVCRWLDEKPNQETPSEGASVPSVSPKETSTPNADTNSVVESENPVTE